MAELGRNHNQEFYEHEHKLTLGQRLADNLAKFIGSWGFVSFMTLYFALWVTLNVVEFFEPKWDPHPFILLNLTLSCFAAMYGPIILMAQNRAVQRDRQKIERDYAVNRKAEREIEDMQQDLDHIKQLIREHHILTKGNHPK